jgi:uncharacterized protein (DUF1015 family)
VPRFEPFAAVRYTATAGDPSDLVAPPYDVIGPDDRAALEARSEHNAVRLELPTDGHDGAARRFRAWLDEGVLARDPSPAFYVYRMTAGDTSTTGILGALTLEAPGEGILPHERTTTKDKADRLGILTATQVNLSPIWALSSAGGRLAAASDPDGLDLLARAVDDADGGVVHELWRLDDPERVAAVTEAVAAQPVLIADGHHRFEVGNAYRAGDDAAPGADAILTYIVELADDQLAVHPIHRLLTGVPADLELATALGEWFAMERVDLDDAEELRRAMDTSGALGLILADSMWLAVPLGSTVEAADDDLDSCRLDVAIAGLAAQGHDAIRLRFQHGAAIVADAVAKGEADAAVLLRPATVAQIEATGQGGQRMPPKTTFFWPKLRTGLVFRDLSE